MLQDLALASLLSTSQIARLAFPSRRRAQRRLRAYLDHGLVHAALQGEAMHRDNVWAISRRGLEHLADHGAELVGVRSVRPRSRSPKIGHALLAREVTVTLLVAERERRLRVLDLKHDAELANELVFATARIIPDGFAAIEIAGMRRALVWEAVTSRQPLAQVLAKHLAYRRAIGAGLALFRDPDLTVLFVFESRVRLDRFAAMTAEQGFDRSIRALHVDDARDLDALLGVAGVAADGFRPLR